MRTLFATGLTVFALLTAAVVPAIASAQSFSVRAAYAGPAYSHHGSRWKLESRGRVVGSATFHCQAGGNCKGTFRFHGRALRGRVVIDPSSRTDRGRITGGSGSYRHARGWFTVHFVNSFNAVFAFHI